MYTKRKSMRGSMLEFGKKMDTLGETAKKLGIKLTVKRNGRRVRKTPVVLAKQIKRAMRKKVVGRPRKSLPFLDELRKNKVSFGVVSLQVQNLEGADLHDANLEGVDLRDANLRDANLEGVDLRGANLEGVDLRGANLRGADLGGADLRWANLEGVDLLGANLVLANLVWADLHGARLQGANLQEAILQWADLEGVDLQGANLQGADLEGANLEGANLEGANLEGARVERDRLDRALAANPTGVIYVGENQVLALRDDLAVVDDVEVCPICQQEGGTGVRTNCGHEFHASCLLRWRGRGRSDCPMCRREGMFFGSSKKMRFGKKPKAKPKALKEKAKVSNKMTVQAKKLGIKLTVKRNGRRVKKTPVVLAKQIKRAMRKKVVGRPRKSLPFLEELRKKMSFGKKPKALKEKAKVSKKMTVQAKKLGIKLTLKRNGRRVRKTPVVLAKQIKRAMRKKVVGRPRKSLPFLEDIRKNRMSDKMGMYFGGGTEALMAPTQIPSFQTKKQTIT